MPNTRLPCNSIGREGQQRPAPVRSQSCRPSREEKKGRPCPQSCWMMKSPQQEQPPPPAPAQAPDNTRIEPRTASAAIMGAQTAITVMPSSRSCARGGPLGKCPEFTHAEFVRSSTNKTPQQRCLHLPTQSASVIRFLSLTQRSFSHPCYKPPQKMSRKLLARTSYVRISAVPPYARAARKLSERANRKIGGLQQGGLRARDRIIEGSLPRTRSGLKRGATAVHRWGAMVTSQHHNCSGCLPR